VSAHRALGQVQVVGEVTDPVLTGLQVLQDRQAAGVGQRMEHRCEPLINHRHVSMIAPVAVCWVGGRQVVGSRGSRHGRGRRKVLGAARGVGVCGAANRCAVRRGGLAVLGPDGCGHEQGPAAAPTGIGGSAGPGPCPYRMGCQLAYDCASATRVATAAPVPPTPRWALSELSRYAGPAMSRWAQVTSPTNSRRNAAAYSAPPIREPVDLMSATFDEVSSSLVLSGIGSGHISSPADSAAASTWSDRSSSLLITPAVSMPSATMHAPVRVATSMIMSGLSSVARTKASAITSRPSASVLPFSTVVPPYMVSTSEGRYEVLDGMFSAIDAYAVTFTPSPSSAIARVAASTAAAPDMSSFMLYMLSPGFRFRPQESKVMPLPTSAMWVFAPRGAYEYRTRRGPREEPPPTARMPP